MSVSCDARELRRQVFGEKHEEVAKDLYYLFAAQQLAAYAPNPETARRDAELQVDTLRQAIELMRETNPANANLPYMLEDMAGIVVRDKDFAQAVRLDNEALSLFRQQYGDAHFNVARIYTHLSKVSEAQGKTAQAAAYRREAEQRMNNLSNRTDAEAVKKLSRLLARTQIMSEPPRQQDKSSMTAI